MGFGRGMGRGYGPGCRYWQAPEQQPQAPKPDVKQPMPPAKDKSLPPWCRLNQQPPKK